MRAAWAIAGKEFRGAFASPIAYAWLVVFLGFTGWFFFRGFFVLGLATMRGFFSLLPWTLVFLVPALTMRLWSEELKLGTLEVLFTWYSVKLKDQFDNTLIPSVYIARSPSLIDLAQKNPYFSMEATTASRNGSPKYEAIGGFNRFIVSCDKGFMTRRAISPLVTTLEWLNYYENLKKYEIDHKKASGSYAWVFSFEDLAAFRTWMSLTDEEKRKTGVGSKMTPGARVLLPPGMKVEIKNPSLTPIREQDTDIMSMAISALNIPEDVATGQAKGTFASVKASRGPMSDRVSDENAFFGRWLQYDFWGSVLLYLKYKMGVMEATYKVKRAVGFKGQEPIIKNVSKPPEQLIDIWVGAACLPCP